MEHQTWPVTRLLLLVMRSSIGTRLHPATRELVPTLAQLTLSTPVAHYGAQSLESSLALRQYDKPRQSRHTQDHPAQFQAPAAAIADQASIRFRVAAPPTSLELFLR